MVIIMIIISRTVGHLDCHSEKNKINLNIFEIKRKMLEVNTKVRRQYDKSCSEEIFMANHKSISERQSQKIHDSINRKYTTTHNL